MPRAARVSFVRRRPVAPRRRIKVIKARIPPSPSLSARMTSRTYFTVTMSVTDQTIIEISSYTLAFVTVTGCGSAGLKIVCTV